MKPFLFFATRPEDAVADVEYESMLKYGQLRESQLQRVRLEAAPMPEIDLRDYSGIIVGGSPFTTSVPTEMKSDTQLRVERELARLLDLVFAIDFPFLGACYGVGTLGSYRGAIIDSTYAEPISAPAITLTEEGRRDPLLDGVPEVFEAYVGHKEAIRELPADAVALATGKVCPVQMFRVKTNIYGTQFHPELDLAGILQRIEVYRLSGYFDPAEQEEIEKVVSGANVSAVHDILGNFTARFARKR